MVILRNCSSSNPTVTPLHQSDHHSISFSLPLTPLPPSPPSTPTVMVRRNLRSLSPSSLASSVTASLPTLESFSNLPTDSASSTLSSSLSSALDSLCPLVSRQARSSPPSSWMSDPIRTNRASLRAAERKWRKSMAQSDLSAYQSMLATFSTAPKLIIIKQKFINLPLTVISCSPFSPLSSALLPHLSPPSLQMILQFSSMRKLQTSAAPSRPPPPFPTPPSVPSPCFSTFSPLTDSVSQLLLSHRPTTCALDPIPSSLLQTITPDILPYVTSLVNSLSSGCFPSSFKLAHITPLLKKPTLDPSVIQNYRPVSLLPFLSKTIERAASNQLSSFLSLNNLLDPYQSGFRPGHSTETALLSVNESLHAAQAASHSSVLILLDLSDTLWGSVAPH
ncbi:mucin-2-like [Anguilla rostrata]|uniref:mucin-2-like n=1 Tax=Anguilla rostrata TaxID=7938 RepID=UPI0030D49D7C